MDDKRNSQNDDQKRKSSEGKEDPPPSPPPPRDEASSSEKRQSNDQPSEETKRTSQNSTDSKRTSDETQTSYEYHRHHYHHHHHGHHRHSSNDETTDPATSNNRGSITPSLHSHAEALSGMRRRLSDISTVEEHHDTIPIIHHKQHYATDDKPRLSEGPELGGPEPLDDFESQSDLDGPSPATSGFITAFQRASGRIANVVGMMGSTPEQGEPEPDMEIEKPESAEDVGLPFLLLDESTMELLEDDDEDRQIAAELSQCVTHYKGEPEQEVQRNIDAKFRKRPEFNYTEMVNILKDKGIPIPSSDGDVARLESSHGKRWDPDGTVVEYYSPVLRSFIPINMRGRYRGCWTEDHCIQGLDISKVSPKPDALEGFVDHGRHVNITTKYKEMSEVADDPVHLDYLIEMEKRQAETLPIPILYDVANFGVEVLKENLEHIVNIEALPPKSRIYQTTENHLLNMRKKVQIYASLGLEQITGDRENEINQVSPMWRMTREELIAVLMLRRHEPDEFDVKVDVVSRMYAALRKEGKIIDVEVTEDENTVEFNPHGEEEDDGHDGQGGDGEVVVVDDEKEKEVNKPVKKKTSNLTRTSGGGGGGGGGRTSGGGSEVIRQGSIPRKSILKLNNVRKSDGNKDDK